MTEQTTIRKLENGRAEFALQCVLSAKGEKFSGDYKSYAKKIPVLIYTNGLGNTLAFIRSKENKAYSEIVENLSAWLRKKESGCTLLPENEDLLEFVISQDSSVYRQITSESLAFMKWISRLADGMIEDKKK